jgi:DNA polymerase III delta prime subunit
VVSDSEANLDNETRVARILADRWVHYPQGEATLTRMAELLRGARRTRMPSLLVVGEPDVGKTTILKKFMRTHAPIFDPETGRATSEVVAIEAPPEADEARLYSAILQAIGAPEGGGRLIDLERIVHLQLKRLGARLLVIDETNNLVIGTGSAQRKTLAALRRLSNQLDLSLACFGTMEALHALTSDPQVEGRVQPFQLTRLRNDADYATIVRSVIAFYPLRQSSDVDQPLIDSVHDLTAGSPGKTFRLLNAAAVHAIDTGEERITLETLRLDDVTRHVRTAAAMRRRVRAAAS